MGTAFFWGTEFAEDKFSVTLVTNKHVLADADEVTVVCHLAKPDAPDEPSGLYANCSISLDPGKIVSHPQFDLCALTFTPILHNAAIGGHPIFHQHLDIHSIPSEKQWSLFDGIENVIMIGCPRGLYDKENNLPIVRSGSTATHIGRLYNGFEEFLIDIACFPGSSGSPVFIFDRNGFFDRELGSYVIGRERFFFIGILYAGPTITNTGEIVLSENPRVEVSAMMHLGQVIRSSAMLWIDARIKEILLGLPGAPKLAGTES